MFNNASYGAMQPAAAATVMEYALSSPLLPGHAGSRAVNGPQRFKYHDAALTHKSIAAASASGGAAAGVAQRPPPCPPLPVANMNKDHPGGGRGVAADAAAPTSSSENSNGIVSNSSSIVSRPLLATCEAATQSDFRESGAQTEPWSPPLAGAACGAGSDQASTAAAAGASVVALTNGRGGKLPKAVEELQALAGLTWEAGCAEVNDGIEQLEKFRAQRAYFEALPPADDVAQLPRRRQLIEAWEAGVWAARNAEIAGGMNARLAALEAQVVARETKIKAERVARVEAARMHLWQQKEKQLESLQKKHDRKARQLNTMVQARKAIMSSAGDAGMLLGETAAVRAAAQTISALTDYTSQVLVGGVGKKW